MTSEIFPPAVLSKHIAFLGMTGSGKTSTNKLAVEHIAQDPRARVCILDTVKSDWWGITSNAAGTGPGLPFTILGGPHGHIPLHESAGAAVGRVVASGALRLSIIDMADFGPGGIQKFFNDFAPALMRANKDPLHLVMEEAHELAPKEKSQVAGETMAVYHAKKLATAGRSKGIRLMPATQRVQSLHNAVLGSCDTVIVHRMIYPADQEPVLKWLRGSVKDKKLRDEIEQSLPHLADGEGWMLSGSARILRRLQFPRIWTFDNTSTPEYGDALRDITSHPIDRDALQRLLGDAVKEAAENDPKVLRARIRELETRPAGDSQWSRAEVLEMGRAEGRRAGIEEGREQGAREMAARLREPLQRYIEDTQAIQASVHAMMPTAVFVQPGMQPGDKIDLPPIPRSIVASEEVIAAHESINRSRASALRLAANGLKPVEQRILNAVAELEQIGAEAPRREMVCFLAGYSNVTSTGFAKAMGAMSSAGHVSSTGGYVVLTDSGRKLAQPPPRPRTPKELQDRISELLEPVCGRVLQPLISVYPKALPRDEVASRAGYSNVTSTGFAKAIGRLSSLGFVRYPQRGMVAAAPVLFLEAG